MASVDAYIDGMSRQDSREVLFFVSISDSVLRCRWRLLLSGKNRKDCMKNLKMLSVCVLLFLLCSGCEQSIDERYAAEVVKKELAVSGDLQTNQLYIELGCLLQKIHRGKEFKSKRSRFDVFRRIDRDIRVNQHIRFGRSVLV
jgi:hypothetical protein